MHKAAKILPLLAALTLPAMNGGAGPMQDGPPPRLLEWPMLPGESLAQLAALIYPGDPAMQGRFISAAERENPATFSGIDAHHTFSQETLIWLPDLKALSRFATSNARPRHYLRPALPAMQPSVKGAEPAPLKMSPALGNQHARDQQAIADAHGVVLAPSPVIRAQNATPVYDAETTKEIDALTARNAALKEEQAALERRIAGLEASLTAAREQLARDRRRIPRREKTEKQQAAPAQPHATESLLPVSPFHLLTLVGVLIAGGGIVWLRRRNTGYRSSRSTPAPGKETGNESAQPESAVDFGAPASQILIEDNFNDDMISVDEIASIVEEAKVFVALGRTDHAIEILEDYITTHPRASAHPWLYLLEVHRGLQQREQFEKVAKRFHKALNIIMPLWDTKDQPLMVVPHSLEEFPHIMARLIEGWGGRQSEEFLNHLLHDNRGGERQGFSMEVLNEILLLLAVLEMRDHLPPLQPG